MVVSIFGRQFLYLPPPLLDTMTPILLGLASLFGAAAAERSGRSIRSPVAVLLFRSATPRVLTLLHGLVAVVVFATVAWAVAKSAMRSLRLGEETYDYIPIPLAPIEAAVALSFALLALFSLISMARGLRRGNAR